MHKSSGDLLPFGQVAFSVYIELSERFFSLTVFKPLSFSTYNTDIWKTAPYSCKKMYYPQTSYYIVTLVFFRSVYYLQQKKGKLEAILPLVPNSTTQILRKIVVYDVATSPWRGGNNRYFLLMKYVRRGEVAPMRDQTSHFILTPINRLCFLHHALS